MAANTAGEPPVLDISQTATRVPEEAVEVKEEGGKEKPEDDMTTLKPLSDFKEDEHISCPYNKAHQILISRMQTHLTKCREVYLFFLILKDIWSKQF